MNKKLLKYLIMISLTIILLGSIWTMYLSNNSNKSEPKRAKLVIEDIIFNWSDLI